MNLDQYETVAQTAERLGVSERRVRQLLADDRLTGAVKLGRDWIIPVGATPAPAHNGPAANWSSLG